MKEISSSNFGLLIAFLLPGFTVLWGVSYFSDPVRDWLSASEATTPTVGGFLYVTLASVLAGVIVSTVRWALIDTIHHWTGLPQPAWDFSRLQANVAAYNVLNEIHYKYYQFHSNMLVALVFVYLARRIHEGFLAASIGWIDLGFLVLALILFVGSRDTLRKYFSRVSHLLGTEPANETLAASVDGRSRRPVVPLPDRTPRSESPQKPATDRSSRNGSQESLA